MLVLHATWTQGELHLWAEDARRWHEPGTSRDADSHPFAADAGGVRGVLSGVVGEDVGTERTVRLRLPREGGIPSPSPTIAHAVGHSAADGLVDGSAGLGEFTAPAIAVGAERAGDVLEALEEVEGEEDGHPSMVLGESVRFFAACARMTDYLLAQQRFVPGLREEASGELDAVWQPWLADAPTLARLTVLAGAMPPIARAAVDSHEHSGWSIMNDALTRMCDAACRRTMVKEELMEAVSSRDAATDTHVALLSCLLGEKRETSATLAQRQELVKGVRTWIGLLEDRGAGDAWRLLLRLSEPIDVSQMRDFASPGEGVRWMLSIHLQLVEQPSVVVDAIDIWSLSGGGATIEGRRLESPHELLLGELGRGARLYKALEKALDEAQPTELHLSTSEAYKFLREFAPILEEQGIGVDVPAWWNSPTVRLGARMKVESEEFASIGPAGVGVGGSPSRAVTQLGLNTLVSYQWQIAVGQTTLTLEQFQALAAQHSPLVRVDGQWVEIRPEDVKAAMDFLKKNPGGEMEIGRALRLAYASDARQTGIQVLGMDATGWVAKVFGDPNHNETLPMLEPPERFIGTLRPYQLKGLSWLAFLDRLGLGACLADDMGLGKTIQLLALLAHERKAYAEWMAANPGARSGGERPEPTLLVVPMSVVGNWIHEARRFTPDLKVLVHHGMERQQGDALHRAAMESDVVITTYALAHRDHDQLSGIKWKRVVLDEAQNIKNPSAKQTQAIRNLATGRRIALTGTPVENRLGELWSIMEFLNPGYLDPAAEFRRRFSVPIERYHDKHRAAQLRGLVQPFVLRRLKSDPAVIADLPEKVESREYCFLTPEQASLYQTCVSDMLRVAEETEGIQRRGVVLAGLIKLKQICNHPAHFLKEQHDTGQEEGAAKVEAHRSGKTLRLIEMLREVIDAGDKALIFTQFRQMGHILSGLLRRSLDRDVLFLHGGSTAPQREEMVSRFQKSGPECPVFILSLKAGGLGLNLTAATHVFHFDRWWNPAVETQATDRAYRIGQTRTVHVHKFVVSGTLEERIDQMIEQKTELAENVIGAGEHWLTELSTTQLREMLSLRLDAIGDEE
ncbi:MAG: DEAD/DEAH box helicase [Phycisphaerales bacterium]